MFSCLYVEISQVSSCKTSITLRLLSISYEQEFSAEIMYPFKGTYHLFDCKVSEFFNTSKEIGGLFLRYGQKKQMGDCHWFFCAFVPPPYIYRRNARTRRNSGNGFHATDTPKWERPRQSVRVILSYE